MVTVANNRSGSQINNEKAMVDQSFDWEDQMQALNLSGREAAHLAQVVMMPQQRLWQPKVR